MTKKNSKKVAADEPAGNGGRAPTTPPRVVPSHASQPEDVSPGISPSGGESKNIDVLTPEEIDKATKGMEEILKSMNSLALLANMQKFFSTKLAHDLQEYSNLVGERYVNAALSPREKSKVRRRDSEPEAADDRTRSKCLWKAAHFWKKYAETQDDFRRALYNGYLALNDEARAYFEARAKAHDRHAEYIELIRPKLQENSTVVLSKADSTSPNSSSASSSFNLHQVPTGKAVLRHFSLNDYEFGIPDPALFLYHGRNPSVYKEMRNDKGEIVEELMKINDGVSAVFDEKNSRGFRQLEDHMVRNFAVDVANKGYSAFKHGLRKTGTWEGMAGLKYYSLKLDTAVSDSSASGSEDSAAESSKSTPPRPVPSTEEELQNNLLVADLERYKVARRRKPRKDSEAGDEPEVPQAFQIEPEISKEAEEPVYEPSYKQLSNANDDSELTVSSPLSEKSGERNDLRLGHIVPEGSGYLTSARLVPMNYHNTRAGSASSNDTSSSAREIYSGEHVDLPYPPPTQKVGGGKVHMTERPSKNNESQKGSVHKGPNKGAKGNSRAGCRPKGFPDTRPKDDDNSDDGPHGHDAAPRTPRGKRYQTHNGAHTVESFPENSRYHSHVHRASSARYGNAEREDPKMTRSFSAPPKVVDDKSTSIPISSVPGDLPALWKKLSGITENTEATAFETSNKTSPLTSQVTKPTAFKSLSRTSQETNSTSVSSSKGSATNPDGATKKVKGSVSGGPKPSGITKKAKDSFSHVLKGKHSPELDRKLQDLSQRLARNLGPENASLWETGSPDTSLCVETNGSSSTSESEIPAGIIHHFDWQDQRFDSLDGFHGQALSQVNLLANIHPQLSTRPMPYFNVAQYPRTSDIDEKTEPISISRQRSFASWKQQMENDINAAAASEEANTKMDENSSSSKSLFSLSTGSSLKRTGKFCRKKNGEFEVSPPLNGKRWAKPASKADEVTKPLKQIESSAPLSPDWNISPVRKQGKSSSTSGRLQGLPHAGSRKRSSKGCSSDGILSQCHNGSRSNKHPGCVCSVNDCKTTHGLGIVGFEEYRRRCHTQRRKGVYADELNVSLAKFKNAKIGWAHENHISEN